MHWGGRSDVGARAAVLAFTGFPVRNAVRNKLIPVASALVAELLRPSCKTQDSTGHLQDNPGITTPLLTV
jgi:hypothetical protein